MPFEQAAKMLERLLGVQVSEATTRRQTEQAGALAEAAQTARAQALTDASAEGVTRLAVSADGAYVPLLKGEWAEVRTVAIGEVAAEGRIQGEQDVHVHHLSYFSRMTDAQTFADLAEVEMRRRGVSLAQEVAAVTDGADWLQGFLDLHRPDALRILDFPHAAEHLNLLIQALKLAGMDLPSDLLTRLLHRLKHNGPRLLLRLLERIPGSIRQQDGVREHVSYFCKRASMMQYSHYREQGWPIGSGMVESANKVVVEARLKGAGMHWERGHVNPMLTLRNAVCNQRWSEGWHEAISEQRDRRHRQRQQQATQRFQQMMSSVLLLFLRSLPPLPKPVPPPPRPAAPAPTLPGSSRPSAHHPWKRAFVLCPKGSAKN